MLGKPIMGFGAVAFAALATGCGRQTVRPDVPVSPGEKYEEQSFQDSEDQIIQKRLLSLSGMEKELLAENAEALSDAKEIVEPLYQYRGKSQLIRLGHHLKTFLRSEASAHVYEIPLLLRLGEIQRDVGGIDWCGNRDEVRMLLAKAAAAKESPMNRRSKTEYRMVAGYLVVQIAIQSDDKSWLDFPELPMPPDLPFPVDRIDGAEKQLDLFFEYCSRFQ